MSKLGAWKSERKLYAFALIGLAFLILYTLTAQDTPGDSRDYITEVMHYGQSAGATPPSVLWEFGHLFWRPLGYLLWQLTQPLTSIWFNGNPIIEISAVFWAINFVSGFALALLMLAIIKRLGIKGWLAEAIALTILLCSAILNYVHSGTPYIPGLALQMAALLFVLRAVQDERNRVLNNVLAGFALALSCAIWFPYFFGIPAILIAAFVFPRNDAHVQSRKEPLLRFASVTGATFIFGLAFFAAGIALAHVASFSQLHDWVLSSGHGMNPHQRILRFPTGLTRSFFYLGDEGMTIKRFVFHDPYAPVDWRMIAAGLWKVAIVFLTFAIVLAALIRNRNSRWVLAVLLGATLPTLFFALVLFETSSSERYLPMFAGLLLAVCVLLRDRAAPRSLAWLLAVFSFGMALVNLQAYAGKLPSDVKRSSNRVALIDGHMRPGGVAIVLSASDPLNGYFEKEPFNPRNQVNALPLYQVIGVHAREFKSWKADSSCRILQAWQAGGNVFFSKRLLATRPKPDWGWVENDDPNVHWVDLQNFYSQLDRDANLGKSDGFVRIAHTRKNESTLAGACPVPYAPRLLSDRSAPSENGFTRLTPNQ